MDGTNLQRYSASKMLNASTELLHQQLEGQFILVFEDGEITTNAHETLVSSYAWDFVRHYPMLKLSIRHHLRTVIGDNRLNASTHRSLLARLVWDVWRQYRGLPGAPTKEQLAKLTYQTVNKLYNFMCVGPEEHAMSLDYMDCVEIMQFPSVKEVLDNLEPTQADIDRAYAALTHAIMKEPQLAHNPISRLARSGLIKTAQVLQCLGPRGFLTDIGSDIFTKVPIMRGYAKGLRHFMSSLIESRSASKAMMFSEGPLQKSEYAARKLQLVGMSVETLYEGDCGSTQYLDWKLQPERRNAEGEKYMDSDLVLMEGVYYLHPDTNQLTALRRTDTHLLGRGLKFRSLVAGCAHPDPHGVCAVCFGELANSIVEKTNLGHMCCAILTTSQTQNILSTKHYDSSSKVQKIELPPGMDKFFRTSPSGNSYMLAPELKGKSVKLVFSEESAPSLTDVFNIEHVDKLSLSYISEIEDVTLLVPHQRGQETIIEPVTLVVSVNKRQASLTYYALEYLKRHNWSYDAHGRYVVDLKDWDVELPLLTLPQRHYNMSDHSQMTNSMIESSKSAVRGKEGVRTPEAMFHTFYETVNSKLSIHFSILSVVVYGAMVKSLKDGNFDIPRAGDASEMGVTPETIPGRSLGPAMNYESHEGTLTNPASFFPENRPSHVMDVFVMPQEAVLDRELPAF